MQVGNPAPAKGEYLSGLRTRWDSQLCLAADNWDFDFGAQCGLTEGDGHRAHQVITISLEYRVLLDVNDYMQVSCRSSLCACFPSSRISQYQSIRSARRYVYGNLGRMGYASLSMARLARIRYDNAFASASGTYLAGDKETNALLNLSSSMA